MIEMRRLHVSRVTVYRYAKPVAFEHRMMFIVRLTDDSWSPQEQRRFSRSAPSTHPAYPNMIEEVRFPPDSPLEGGGFEPSVPRQKVRSRCWHPDDHRRNAPPKVRLARDSPLEGEGFEPSVPVRRTTLFETPPAN